MSAADVDTGALIIQAYEAGMDLNSMLASWLQLSKEKSWPLTSEGLRRYFARIGTSGPKRADSAAPPSRNPVVWGGESFTEWWKDHPHAGHFIEDGESHWTLEPLKASRCQRYQDEWKKSCSGKDLK